MKLSEIQQRTGLTYAQTLAVVSLLEAELICKIVLLVLHNCQQEPVDTLPFGEGLPSYQNCPVCGKEAEFMYEFQVKKG